MRAWWFQRFIDFAATMWFITQILWKNLHTAAKILGIHISKMSWGWVQRNRAWGFCFVLIWSWFSLFSFYLVLLLHPKTPKHKSIQTNITTLAYSRFMLLRSSILKNLCKFEESLIYFILNLNDSIWLIHFKHIFRKRRGILFKWIMETS